jgi:hypothetical protein
MSLSNSALNILSLVTNIISLIGITFHIFLLIALILFFITYARLETELNIIFNLLNGLSEDGSMPIQEASDGRSWYKEWDR